MYIVKVIPFLGSLSHEELTYYSKDDLNRGSIVQILVRKKKVYGLVIESQSLRDMRSSIRGSDFSLKKIEAVLVDGFFIDGFLRSAEHIAHLYACTPGQVLSQIVPGALLSNLETLSTTEGSIRRNQNAKKETKPFALQTTKEKRFQEYNTLTTTAMTKGESVFIVIPDRITGEQILEFLENDEAKDINHTLLHSALPKRKLAKNINHVLETPSPQVIIGTTSFLSLARETVRTIILESEDSYGYHGQKRPYLDLRDFVHTFAKETHAQLLVSASVLTTESAYFVSSDTYTRHEKFEEQLTLPEKVEVLDMSQKDDEAPKKKQVFQPLSDRVMKELEHSLARGENTFIFSLRKGISGTTICGDCGDILTCKNCSTPMLLINTNSGRAFRCGKCGAKESAKTLCRNCGSYKLTALGIGIDRLREFLEKHFKDTPIFQIDGQYTNTYNKAKKEYARFREAAKDESKGVILLGTEQAISHIDLKLDHSIIATLDSLYAIPDFRIDEKVYSLLAKTIEWTNSQMLIQTRNPDAAVLKYALHGKTSDFQKTLISEREMFRFPPFSTLIKITFRGAPDQIEEQKKRMMNFFKAYQPEIYPAFTEKVRGKHVLNTLLRIPRDPTDDSGGIFSDDLSKRLKALPFSYEVRIRPENIL